MTKHFYGIEEIQHIFNGEWSDPTLIYKGEEISYFHLEDAMYNSYCDDGLEGTQSFDEYMLNHKDEVLEIADYLLENNIK